MLLGSKRNRGPKNNVRWNWTLNKDPRPRLTKPPQLLEKRSENLLLQTTKTNNYSHTLYLDREETFTYSGDYWN